MAKPHLLHDPRIKPAPPAQFNMNADRIAHCQATVDAFIAQVIRADEFVLRLAQLWHHDAGGACADHRLIQIHALCNVYTRALPAGAGYRVSEEQFRSEIQRLAAWRQRL